MRLISSRKQNNESCDEGEYCVQVYSRSASLVNEFCLNKQENNIPDIEAAEALLRQTLTPSDLASTTVTLISGDGTNNETVTQFGLSEG